MEVAARLEGRNNKDCRKRWAYSLAPSIKKGPWDEYEDAALRQGVRQCGTRYVRWTCLGPDLELIDTARWSEVARYVGTRQADRKAAS